MGRCLFQDGSVCYEWIENVRGALDSGCKRNIVMIKKSRREFLDSTLHDQPLPAWKPGYLVIPPSAYKVIPVT